jgi:cytochrome P450
MTSVRALLVLLELDNLLLYLPESRRAMVAAQNLLGLTRQIMNDYRNKTRSLMALHPTLTIKSKAFPSDDEKAAQLLEFLIAGQDTTGNR